MYVANESETFLNLVWILSGYETLKVTSVNVACVCVCVCVCVTECVSVSAAVKLKILCALRHPPLQVWSHALL